MTHPREINIRGLTSKVHSLLNANLHNDEIREMAFDCVNQLKSIALATHIALETTLEELEDVQ